MHIPEFWALARQRQQRGMRHGVTVQRWGWSDTSQQDAQAHAEARTAEALQQVLQAQSAVAPQSASAQPRREALHEYSLTSATPIREEVLERRDCGVMTRNSYGAHCLNTPHVAIADIDLQPPRAPSGMPWLACLLLVAATAFLGYGYLQHVDTPASLRLVASVTAAFAGLRLWQWWQGRQHAHASMAASGALPMGPPQTTEQALELLRSFAHQHPQWGVRVYATPKGLRAIATHGRLAPDAAEVQQWFAALQVDPLYQLLCRQQQCFRARVSAKPWRMGMNGPSVSQRQWPLASTAQQQQREEWTAHYDRLAQGFAACRLIEQLGQQTIHAEVQPFVQWHDRCSQAESELKLA